MNFGQGKFDIVERSSKLLYRDLIKMVKKTMPDYKHKSVLTMLRREFDKNKNITNAKDIETLKRNAGKSIADSYVLFVKDSYLKSINKDKI